MTPKAMRLVDFQVALEHGIVGQAIEKTANESFFPVYEALRLWLKERTVMAPFGKIVVTVASEQKAEVHGRTFVALGICTVFEVSPIDAVLQAADNRLVGDVVRNALRHIREGTRWSDAGLSAFASSLGTSDPVCSHRFAKLRRCVRRAGVCCDVWFVAGRGHSAVQVRFSKGDLTLGVVEVASRRGPLFLEDVLPVSRTAIRGAELVLLGRGGAPLANVPIPEL